MLLIGINVVVGVTITNFADKFYKVFQFKIG